MSQNSVDHCKWPILTRLQDHNLYKTGVAHFTLYLITYDLDLVCKLHKL